MKKLSSGFGIGVLFLRLFCLGLFCLPAAVQAQAVDKAQYKAIDPFDYKLEEEKAAKGAVRKYKSVVQYVSQSGSVLNFASLDQNTKMSLSVARNISALAAAQRVTIYYTATKGIIDALALDEIDASNTTEAGIGLAKPVVSASSGIKKADYNEIDPFDYKIDAENAQRGETRKFKSTVLFSGQSGINYSFVSLDEGTMLSMKVGRRIPPLTANQKVTIFYTATKGIVDSLFLDDIEL